MVFIIFICDKEVYNKIGRFGNIMIVLYIFFVNFNKNLFIFMELCFVKLFDIDIDLYQSQVIVCYER